MDQLLFLDLSDGQFIIDQSIYNISQAVRDLEESSVFEGELLVPVRPQEEPQANNENQVQIDENEIQNEEQNQGPANSPAEEEVERHAQPNGRQHDQDNNEGPAAVAIEMAPAHMHEEAEDNEQPNGRQHDQDNNEGPAAVAIEMAPAPNQEAEGQEQPDEQVAPVLQWTPYKLLRAQFASSATYGRLLEWIQSADQMQTLQWQIETHPNDAANLLRLIAELKIDNAFLFNFIIGQFNLPLEAPVEDVDEASR